MQALYITYNPDGDSFKLPYCIIVFGCFQFIMSQLPDLHSLRFVNALSNVCTLVFSTIAIGMSIHNGMLTVASQQRSCQVIFPPLCAKDKASQTAVCAHLSKAHCCFWHS